MDNGDTWTATKFFHASARWYGTPAEYPDPCYIPTQGCVAVDNAGKVHVAFGTRLTQNVADEGYLSLYQGCLTSFLSYWNENMEPLDGAEDFPQWKIEDLIFDHFIDEYQSGYDYLYIKSNTPKWPIAGFYTGNPYFYMPDNYEWLLNSYGRAGLFSFPQMVFDRDNVLHLTYLGMVNGGSDDNRWFRHPYYTATPNYGTNWSETKYLVNTIDLIDKEFAYLTLAGIDDSPDQWVYLMAQVDPYAGVYTPYINSSPDHSSTTNYYYHFHIHGDDIAPCYVAKNLTVDYTEDCKAELAWEAPAEDDFTYKIYRDGNLIATIEETLYTDEGFEVTVGHTWGVTVNCGDGESIPVSVTKDFCIPPPPPPCDPVTDADAGVPSCDGATITWTAVEGAVGYKISRDGNLLATVTTPEYTEKEIFWMGDIYTWVIVTICTENESEEVEITAVGDCMQSINELLNNVAIYPNPVSGMITIEAADFAKVEVYNSVGQLIETKTVKTFDVSSYDAGLYFFKVYDTTNNSVTKRVMVAR